LAVHAAYWKYAVRRRITGEKRGSFALKGSNFFPRPLETTAAAWKSDLVLLETTHRSLREVIAGLSDRDLARVPAGSTASVLGMVNGIAAHDLYHAGQIQLLKRLMPASV
jgi:DinB family protein